MKTRKAAVEGRFYPSTKTRIFDQIRTIENMGFYAEIDAKPERIFGAVLPHAGHFYSGHQTIPFFKLIRKLKMFPETFVIVHPNHTGPGPSVAIDNADAWVNSIGEVALDRELAVAMELPFDPRPHANEHSAEVIIPFIQYYLPENSFSIVPICLSDQSHLCATELAHKVFDAMAFTGRNAMVIASSDFSHFLSPQAGTEKDQVVIDQIFSRNSAGIERSVKEHHVSVCGYGPVMVLMEYAGYYDENYKIEILARGHSGLVVQSREVVDYISMILYQ